MVKILFDPGHSSQKDGAQSTAFGIGEHELNLIQARVAYKKLKELGFDITIFDPAKDDLALIGTQAKGYDCFLSMHLNASASPEPNYTAVCVHDGSAKPASKILGTKIVFEFVKSLQLKAYKGPFGPGLMFLPLAVLKNAEKVCRGPCVLTEAFFLSSDDYKSKEELIAAAELAGVAIANGVQKFFASFKLKA